MPRHAIVYGNSAAVHPLQAAPVAITGRKRVSTIPMKHRTATRNHGVSVLLHTVNAEAQGTLDPRAAKRAMSAPQRASGGRRVPLFHPTGLALPNGASVEAANGLVPRAAFLAVNVSTKVNHTRSV